MSSNTFETDYEDDVQPVIHHSREVLLDNSSLSSEYPRTLQQADAEYAAQLEQELIHASV